MSGAIMRHRLTTVATSFFLYALLALTIRSAQALPGFPALEIVDGADENSVHIVAREVHLQETLSYSCGYFTPVKAFAPPPFFSFTIYGYHDEPQWGEIKSVQFNFGENTFTGEALYTVRGPDRDKTLDTQDSEYFESMIVKVPPDVARQIVANNGVLVTTEPFSFYLPIPASKLDRFKQLVNSVAEFQRNQQARSKPKLLPKQTPRLHQGQNQGQNLHLKQNLNQRPPLPNNPRRAFQSLKYLMMPQAAPLWKLKWPWFPAALESRLWLGQLTKAES